MIFLLSIAAALVVTGCADDRGRADGGVGRDGGIDRDGGGGVDGGGASGVDTAAWSISGAQNASFTHDDESNYVRCTDTGSGLFAIDAASSAGGSDSLSIRFYGYFGPGTYEVGYRGASDDPTGDVRLAGGYSYWIFYNSSTIDFSLEIPTTCTITVAEATPGSSRVDISLSCAGLVAVITSPDYDDRDAAGLRPSIDLTAEVSCTL